MTTVIETRGLSKRFKDVAAVDKHSAAAELGEDLPAGTARPARAVGADDRDGVDLAEPGRDHRHDGAAFRAQRGTVGGVLHVAAGEDLTRRREHGGADGKAAVGGVGVGGGAAGLVQQVERHGSP